MKIYLKQNVYDKALERINWLFDEFENVIVNISGGKDSTVVLNLALKVAEERGRLPLNVMFLDQEIEWECVINYVRDIMNDPRVKPYWLQVPFLMFNATSPTKQWLECWHPDQEWIRPKEEIAIKENVFGQERFAKMFDGFIDTMFPKQKACFIAGVRAEESPSRFVGLTAAATYKGETWGKVNNKSQQHYTFYPIYDWSYKDVWKSINDFKWQYCALYDYMYQYGVALNDMRVSNVNHETSLKSLFFLQEIEPDTWNKIAARLDGINSVKHLKEDFLAIPKTLPYMFKDWYEYRDYLLKNLIEDPANQKTMADRFKAMDERYDKEVLPELLKVQLASIMANDVFGTKLSVFAAKKGSYVKGTGETGGKYALEARQRREAKKNAKTANTK